ELGEDAYPIEYNAKILVKKGDKVTQNQIISKGQNIQRAINAGIIKEVAQGRITIKHSEPAEKTYSFPQGEMIIVENRQAINAGDPLNMGHFNLKELFDRTDAYVVQKYLMSEVQKIYASQGQTINDKHIEIIVKQMFSKVRIIDPGDAKDMLPGEVVDIQRVYKINQDAKKPVVYERLLLGLTRIALATDSWLSAASFQETIRVLVGAATTGKIDSLEGLKENVIIGRLIPAGHVYRKKFYEEL
ncbi:MAG: DNA-directed RNA polymerase subunit beta', partial [Candidatus Gracilibacteria bacterium]|nr:DNA-directed RNA polymerase subunit beta' [Candidatus Gracilibacteria bacterium]